MNLTEAKSLVEFSDVCYQWSPASRRTVEVPLPGVLDVLLATRVGGRTVATEEGVLTFDCKRGTLEGMLVENPDTVAGRYPRHWYNFVLFIGDPNGAVLFRGKGLDTHSEFLRKLVKSGATAPKENWTLEPRFLPKDCFIVGSPAQLVYEYTGVILPRQGDVPATYLSFWEKAPDTLVAPLLKFAMSEFRGPFKKDVTVNKESIVSNLHA